MGRVERGVIRAGETVEIVGIREETLSVSVKRIEAFQKTLTFARVGLAIACVLGR
ncbi:EF-Tu/IF-2/RF-3 family GTPase [Ktedonosporobacter rubrisoli]